MFTILAIAIGAQGKQPVNGLDMLRALLSPEQLYFELRDAGDDAARAKLLTEENKLLDEFSTLPTSKQRGAMLALIKLARDWYSKNRYSSDWTDHTLDCGKLEFIALAQGKKADMLDGQLVEYFNRASDGHGIRSIPNMSRVNPGGLRYPEQLDTLQKLVESGYLDLPEDYAKRPSNPDTGPGGGAPFPPPRRPPS